MSVGAEGYPHPYLQHILVSPTLDLWEVRNLDVLKYALLLVASTKATSESWSFRYLSVRGNYH